LFATNISLLELIRLAYEVHVSQIVGGPDWIESARFDVIAKAETSRPPSPAMIRRLLSDRFNLAIHNETRRLRQYALVTIRSDRRLGPQLRPSQIDCTRPPAAADARDRSAPFVDPERRQVCEQFVGLAPRFDAAGVNMAQLATSLSRHVGRPVVDRTGLVGLFDLSLQWTPDVPQASGSYRLNGVEVDPGGPSIFTALQEQLGLRLESTEAPAPVIVVDRAERPVED
jgi:uncharacterized protein (TIGR03435 family)